MKTNDMTTDERIAKALEVRNEITIGILYGLLGAGLIVVGIFAFMILAQPVYGFFYHDVFGYERVAMGTMVANKQPIDDCNYSEDEQLCYQMQRVADALQENKP